MFSHHESRKQLYLWDKLQSDEEKYQTTRSVENGDATTFLKSFRIATVSEIHCLADPSLLTSFFVWAEAITSRLLRTVWRPEDHGSDQFISCF